MRCPSLIALSLVKKSSGKPQIELAHRFKDVMGLDELPDINDSSRDHLPLEVNFFFVILLTIILFPVFRLQKIDLLENMLSLNPTAINHCIGFKSCFWLLSLGYPVLAI